MNQKNYEYLCDQLKLTGFKEDLEDNLKSAIQQGKPEFKLDYHTQYGSDRVSARLNFEQSKKSDMYFFNSYQVSVQKEGTDDKFAQSFLVQKGQTFTLKEAYNLMSGRAVNKYLLDKDGEFYNAWVRMDFKEPNEKGNYKLRKYHQNYGYDLEKVLNKHPIRELSVPEFKKNLIESLKKGNRQLATFQKDGIDVKQYIEASPQFKTINIYDENMQRVNNRELKRENKSQAEDNTVKQESKKERQSAADEDGPEMSQTPKRKRKKQAQAV